MRRIHLVALSALWLAAAPALAQSSSGNVITLTTSIAYPSAQPGGFNEGACMVSNDTTETIRVSFEATVTYADGTSSRLVDDPPIEVDPGRGTGMQVLFFVPEDTALGPAVFQCEAQATGPGGHEREVGTAGFQVVAP